MNVQPPTNSPLEPSGTKDSLAVKPSKDFEEVLTEINAGLRELEEKGKHEH